MFKKQQKRLKFYPLNRLRISQKAILKKVLYKKREELFCIKIKITNKSLNRVVKNLSVINLRISLLNSFDTAVFIK